MDNKVKNLAILSGDSYFTKIINDLDIFYKEKLSDKSYKVLNTEEKENGFQAKVYKTKSPSPMQEQIQRHQKICLMMMKCFLAIVLRS